MKTLKHLFILLLITGVGLGLHSCKKKLEDDAEDDMAAQMQQSNDESVETMVSEDALNDVNDAMSNASFGKSFSILSSQRIFL